MAAATARSITPGHCAADRCRAVPARLVIKGHGSREGITSMKSLVLTLVALGAALGLGHPARAEATDPAWDAQFLCTGGDVAGQLAPVKVSIRVDAFGAVKGTWATWSLGGGDVVHAPAVQFDYPGSTGAPARWPDGLSVLAVAAMNPPPKAMTWPGLSCRSTGLRRPAGLGAWYGQGPRLDRDGPWQNTVGFLRRRSFYPDLANPADAGLIRAVARNRGVRWTRSLP